MVFFFCYRNFQLSVARQALGRNDEMQSQSLIEQRQAFSCLKSIGSGKQVGVMRTGDRVRDFLPGAVPQSLIPHKAPNSLVPVYQVLSKTKINNKTKQKYKIRHFEMKIVFQFCRTKKINTKGVS